MTKHVFHFIYFNLARFSDSLVMASFISLIFFSRLITSQGCCLPGQRVCQLTLPRFSESLVMASSVSLIFSPLGNMPMLPFALRGCQFNCGGFQEVSEISIRWSSISVACWCQQPRCTWIRHSTLNHPQDRTLWIHGELPWHVLMFLQNIPWINIFLCKSEYDPFFRVAGICCADDPLTTWQGFLIV